jgi:Helix-turn-helix domain
MRQITNSLSTQRSRILALLIAARGGWVSLPEILDLRISQYNVRLMELRGMGFRIENRREAQRKSFFRLVRATPPSDSLFPDMAERHWDLG